jgi:hypothetical protein
MTVRPKLEPDFAALVDRFVALAVDHHDALSIDRGVIPGNDPESRKSKTSGCRFSPA